MITEEKYWVLNCNIHLIMTCLTQLCLFAKVKHEKQETSPSVTVVTVEA